MSYTETYDELVKEILNCSKCELHKHRRRAVPGEGPLNAEVMIVGEAPGEKEDIEGRPFVGPAGQLLTKILEKIGLPRSQAYITNIVKCRPPENRDPKPEEINACLPYLVKQILIIKPKVIICLGRHSARELLRLSGMRSKYTQSISRIRGQIFDVNIQNHRVILTATYHPASALYDPSKREIIENDLRKVIDSVKLMYTCRRSLITDYL